MTECSDWKQTVLSKGDQERAKRLADEASALQKSHEEAADALSKATGMPAGHFIYFTEQTEDSWVTPVYYVYRACGIYFYAAPFQYRDGSSGHYLRVSKPRLHFRVRHIFDDYESLASALSKMKVVL